MITDPRYLTVVQWCDLTTLQLATLAPVPKLIDPEQWHEWALIVIAIPAVSSFAPPDPRYFDDWNSWAQRFIECVNL